MGYYEQVKEAADAVRARVRDLPQTAIVLGSGLGDFANSLTDAVTMPYSELPHWPASRVIGHDGRLVVGRSRGRVIAALAGRVHLYEGHDLRTVTFAIRVLGLLGVKTLIVTNAAGGINLNYSEGALVALRDHINLQGANPLIGPNDGRFGLRFPDMTRAYDPDFRRFVAEAGKELDLNLHEGVYLALCGPNYETPAEIRALRTLGADLVGMSTVPEVLAARHSGIRVLGISCVTNMAAGVTGATLTAEEVFETGARVRHQFIALLKAVIPRIAKAIA